MHICSPTIQYFSQPPLAMLLVVTSHAGAVTVKASGICDRVAGYPKSFTNKFAKSPGKTAMQN
jgi:hypothetical protein